MGVFWGGPYNVPANSVTEAKDILTDVILKEQHNENGPLHMIRLLEVEHKMTPGRAEEHFPSVSEGIKEELHRRKVWLERMDWKLQLEATYPNGVPKYRSLDAEWNC